ncbi:MAG: QueT transporter family protein [Nitrososphaerota archaeon]
MSYMKMTQQIAEMSVIAAIYFVMTFALAPISFLPFQVRLSDALIMLSAILGLPAVYGVFLGCLFANLFPLGYPPNPIDVVLGSLANLMASYAVYRICYGKLNKLRVILSSLASSLIITLIVGSYLPALILPSFSWWDVVWIGYLGVLPGELIAQSLTGSTIVLALARMLKLRK